MSAANSRLSPSNLVDRVRLGARCATRMVDPDRDFLPYWGIKYDGTNALAHGRIDNCDTPYCWMEILLTSKALGGDGGAEDVEAGLRNLCETDFHPDGLRYPGGGAEDPHAYCFLHGLSYVLDAMVSWYGLTGEPQLRRRIDDMVAGLHRIAAPANLHADLVADQAARETARTPALYFPFNNYVPGRTWNTRTHSVINSYELPGTGTHILPLTRYYELTGNETARILAEGLTHYMLNVSHLYGFDGRFVGHFHRHAWSVAGMMKLAGLIGHDGHMAKARRIYDFLEQLGTPFGWFPEMVGLNQPPDDYCETCCIYDMIHGALTLAQSGEDAYWDKVSAYARNHLARNQLTDVDGLADWPLADTLLGGFSGYTQVNDFLTRDGVMYICGCCTFHGVKALRAVWEATTEARGDATWIHLFFDKEDDRVAVQCRAFDEGRIDVRAKRAGDVYLRIPAWARGNLAAHYKDQPLDAEWRGTYLRFGALGPGDDVAVTFTVPRTSTEAEGGGQRLTVDWEGDLVTGVRPEGTRMPLYGTG